MTKVDLLSTALALVALGVAVLSLILYVRRGRREEPKLTVTATIDRSQDGSGQRRRPPAFIVTVRNLGRSPIGILRWDLYCLDADTKWLPATAAHEAPLPVTVPGLGFVTWRHVVYPYRDGASSSRFVVEVESVDGRAVSSDVLELPVRPTARINSTDRYGNRTW